MQNILNKFSPSLTKYRIFINLYTNSLLCKTILREPKLNFNSIFIFYFHEINPCLYYDVIDIL